MENLTKFEKKLNNELWRLFVYEPIFKRDDKKYTKELAKVLLKEMQELLLTKEK